MTVMFPWDFYPFNKDTIKKLQQMRPDEVENYIQDVMGKVFPPGMNKEPFQSGFSSMNNTPQPEPPHSPSVLNESVFETLDYVYVIIPIKEEDSFKNMKIAHTSNQLMIKHVPTWDENHTIVLPAIVRRKGSTATYRDGKLEIRFQKSIDWQYTEIDIQDKH